MAGKIKQVRIVTFKEDFGRYAKGEHAMNVSVADKLVKLKAPVTVKEVKMEEIVSKIKTKKAQEKKKAEEASKAE